MCTPCTNDALSNNTNVDDLVTFSLYLKITISGLCCRLVDSVSQTHLYFGYACLFLFSFFFIQCPTPFFPKFLNSPVLSYQNVKEFSDDIVVHSLQAYLQKLFVRKNASNCFYLWTNFMWCQFSATQTTVDQLGFNSLLFAYMSR